jgi:hypothetical protein
MAQLREGVSALSTRVQALTDQYDVVAALQRRQMDVDGKAAEAVRQAAAALATSREIKQNTVPREEVEKNFADLAMQSVQRQKDNNRNVLIASVIVLIISLAVAGYGFNSDRDEVNANKSTISAVQTSRAQSCTTSNLQKTRAAADERMEFKPYLREELQHKNPDPVIVQILTSLSKVQPILTDCSAIEKSQK